MTKGFMQVAPSHIASNRIKNARVYSLSIISYCLQIHCKILNSFFFIHLFFKLKYS